MSSGKIIFKAALALIFLEQSKAQIPTDRSLESCKAVAAQFDNTCENDEAVFDFAAHRGATMRCTGQIRCPGSSGEETYTESNPCVFTRKLCVSCEEANGAVMMRVQTNSLPNHCFTSTVNNASERDTEWRVAFNPDVKGVMNYVASDFDSQSKTDEKLCDIQRTSMANMHAVSQYEEFSRRRELQRRNRDGGGGGSGSGSGDSSMTRPPRDGGNMQQPGGMAGPGSSLNTVSGIALSGAYIFNALDGTQSDAVESEARTMDVCLSHPSPFGGYHYHYWSPCILKGRGFAHQTVAPALCKDDQGGACMNDTSDFVMENGLQGQALAYSEATWDQVIGVARDGHVIIGPFKPDGSTWGCDRDVCNGVFINDSYVYVGSDRFPYVVGCWGPGPDSLFEPSCSSSGCGAGDGSNQVVNHAGSGASSLDQEESNQAESPASQASNSSNSEQSETDLGVVIPSGGQNNLVSESKNFQRQQEANSVRVFASVTLLAMVTFNLIL